MFERRNLESERAALARVRSLQPRSPPLSAFAHSFQVAHKAAGERASVLNRRPAIGDTQPRGEREVDSDEQRGLDRAQAAEERGEHARERAKSAHEDAERAQTAEDAEMHEREAEVHERAAPVHEQALQRLVADLPPELPAAVLVVLHLMQSGTSVLDSILARAGQLPASQARDGERPERGHIYVSPPNVHLPLRGPSIHPSDGPRENGHRPAIDPLFRSAARAFGPRAIGVVLSGTLDDGTDGLRLIKERGGATVVQDPDDATYGDMPRSAIEYVEPDEVVSMEAMGRTLYRLLDSPLDPRSETGVADPASQPIDLVEAELGREPLEGQPSLLTCPDCGGVLIDRDEGAVIRFACQVGHAYPPESLVEEQGSALESALWSALRTLQERADLLRRMARRAELSGAETTRGRLHARAEAVSEQAGVVRETILRLRGFDAEPVSPPA